MLTANVYYVLKSGNEIFLQFIHFKNYRCRWTKRSYCNAKFEKSTFHKINHAFKGK